MATNPTPLTAEDLFDLLLPDGVTGYELVDGRPVPVTAAFPTHARLIGEIAYGLVDYVKRAEIAGSVYVDAGFVLRLHHDRERMRAPDVSFVVESKVIEHGDPSKRFFRGAPDLAIEVDLTTERKRGGQQRIEDYLEAGARLVWATHPRTHSAMVYRHDGSTQRVRSGEALDGEAVIPGFSLRLATLFRDSATSG